MRRNPDTELVLQLCYPMAQTCAGDRVAQERAYRLDHAVYDCAYLALALHLDGAYVTADQRFWRKAQRPELNRRVLSLAEL
jgi:hypothetical protein